MSKKWKRFFEVSLSFYQHFALLIKRCTSAYYSILISYHTNNPLAISH